MKTYHYTEDNLEIICKVDVDKENRVIQILDTHQGSDVSLSEAFTEDFQSVFLEEMNLFGNVSIWDWVICDKDGIKTIHRDRSSERYLN